MVGYLIRAEGQASISDRTEFRMNHCVICVYCYWADMCPVRLGIYKKMFACLRCSIHKALKKYFYCDWPSKTNLSYCLQGHVHFCSFVYCFVTEPSQVLASLLCWVVASRSSQPDSSGILRATKREPPMQASIIP